MSGIAKGYFDALVALSKNPDFIDTREGLIKTITKRQLKDVIQHGIRENISRQDLEIILVKLLDIITYEPVVKVKTEASQEQAEATAPPAQLHGAAISNGRATGIAVAPEVAREPSPRPNTRKRAARPKDKSPPPKRRTKDIHKSENPEQECWDYYLVQGERLVPRVNYGKLRSR